VLPLAFLHPFVLLHLLLSHLLKLSLLLWSEHSVDLIMHGFVIPLDFYRMVFGSRRADNDRVLAEIRFRTVARTGINRPLDREGFRL
jgi:hypothetical protein